MGIAIVRTRNELGKLDLRWKSTGSFGLFYAGLLDNMRIDGLAA